MNTPINNLPKLKKHRQTLRNNLTPAEATLWGLLKNKQLGGRKFRRQFSIGNYIIDFYCFSEKLAIELDGSAHYTEEGKTKDVTRDSYLKKLGITVLRIENKLVFENQDQVLDYIKSHFKKQLTYLPPPSRFA